MGYLTGSPICTTGTQYYANNVACAVDKYIDEFKKRAIDAEAALDTALSDLSSAFNANTTPPDYNPNVSAVPVVFTAPTAEVSRPNYASLQPSVVNLPARSGLLSEQQSDAVFARARARVTRAHAANIRAALEVGGIGIGLAAPSLLARLAGANQKAAEGVSMVALEQAAQEGVWEREDIKLILDLEMKDFESKWKVVQQRVSLEEETLKTKISNYLAQIQKEAERRGWSAMEIDQIMNAEAEGAKTLLTWGQLTLAKLMDVEEKIVRSKAAVFQTWLQAADLGLNFSGSQAVSD